MKTQWSISSIATAWLAIAFSLPSVFAQSKNEDAQPLKATMDPAQLRQTTEQRLREHGHNVKASLWLGSGHGECWFERNSADIRPTASAIKTFFLVELFAAFEGRLDQPLPDAAQFLRDDHPAISHFSPEVRDEIRRELREAPVRRVGEIMMGKTKVSNAVYNAAANLVTAQLGGPESLTKAIHRRSPAFQDVTVRRYMLRDRKQPGDNTGSAAALASLYQALATKQLPGISPETMTAVHAVLFRREDQQRGALYEKGGSLNSDPLTAVRAGWRQRGDESLIFVVMLEQPTPGDTPRAAAGDALNKLAVTLLDLMVP